MLDDILSEQSPDSEKHVIFRSEENKIETGERRKIPIKLVSFDDYYVLWRGIATSIVNYKKSDENDCELLVEDYFPKSCKNMKFIGDI